ncbi:MAG: hypothetical protein WA708_07050 [Acidobacteriaceae bacterium]
MQWSESDFDLKLKIVAALAMIISLAGCGVPSHINISGPGPTDPAPTAAESAYVIQNPAIFGSGSGMILQFSSTATGAATPKSTITAPADTSFGSLATDSSGNIYVAANSPISLDVREYSTGSTGSATPIRLLPSNTTTLLSAPDGIDTDATGEIFVSEDTGGIATYSEAANGSVAPVSYILGAAQTGGGLSTLIEANAVAADSSGNLYIMNEGAPNLMPICVFSPGATGNVAPARTIGGANTTIDSMGGLTIDSVGNLYVSSSTSNSNGIYAGSILEFAPTASGNVAPTRVITGSSTQLGKLGGIKVDSTGNIFVVSTDSTGKNPTVLEFSDTATGNAAPTSSFTSSAWTNPDNGISIAVH